MNIRIFALILAVLSVLPTLFSCAGEDAPQPESGMNSDTKTEYETTENAKTGLPAGAVICDAEDKTKYYFPEIFKTTVVPCRINVATGQIQYACPVRGCDHKGKDCYYYNTWVTSAFDTGRFLFMTVLFYPTGLSYVLAYEWDRGRIYNVCKTDNMFMQLVPGDVSDTVCLYRQTSSSSADHTTTKICAYNVFTGAKLSVRSVRGDLIITHCENDVLYCIDAGGAVIIKPGEEDTQPYVYPEGCEGYKVRKPGVLYKTDAPAALYDTKSGVTVYPDPSLDITSPVKSGDSFYYQSRGKVTAAKKADGSETKYVRYDKVIYKQSADGKTDKITVDTDYHFIIYAVSGDHAVGRLMYKITDGVYTPFEELDHDHIWIDLKTGEAQPLDLYKDHDYFL